MSYFSKISGNIKTTGVYLLMNFFQNIVINMVLTTRYNIKADRQYIMIKTFLILLMTTLSGSLTLWRFFITIVMFAIVQLSVSFFVNTSTRYIYATLDYLRRSITQQTTNFVEIPDPILFLDSSSYQIIYYNFSAEKFFVEELKDHPKVFLVDMIDGEDEKFKFRQLATTLLESKLNESEETSFFIRNETNQGVKLIKYNLVL